jgi:ABC-type uncharacterized transport system permease subunit
MRLLRKCFYIFLIALKSSVYFRSRIIAQGLMQVFRLAILAAAYSFVFQSVKVNSNITVQMAVWSIAAYFTILSIRFKNLFMDINDDVKMGNIEVLLNRPVNYLIYRIINQLGSDIFGVMIPLVFCFIFLPVYIGFPQIHADFLWFMAVAAVSILGLAVGALMYSVIGFAAFWIEDARPVYWILDKFVLLLGGSYLPIVFFPDWVKTLVYTTPFGASMYVSHVFYPDFMTRLPWLLLSQIIWIVLLGLFSAWVFSRARLRLVVNGG